LAKVVWTAEAERWLLKIHDYIALDSPVNAFNVVKSIYQRGPDPRAVPARWPRPPKWLGSFEF